VRHLPTFELLETNPSLILKVANLFFELKSSTDDDYTRRGAHTVLSGQHASRKKLKFWRGEQSEHKFLTQMNANPEIFASLRTATIYNFTFCIRSKLLASKWSRVVELDESSNLPSVSLSYVSAQSCNRVRTEGPKKLGVFWVHFISAYKHRRTKQTVVLDSARRALQAQLLFGQEFDKKKFQFFFCLLILSIKSGKY